MSALTGMEKFSHLEDKIYLTVEYAKKMRDEKERLERETASLRSEVSDAVADKHDAVERLNTLLAERDTIQLKIEAMLEAITSIDADVADAVRR